MIIIASLLTQKPYASVHANIGKWTYQEAFHNVAC